MATHLFISRNPDRRSGSTRPRRLVALATLAAVVASVVAVTVPSAPAFAASVSAIDLGRATPFAILAGASVGNTATGPTTIVRGDLGVLAAAGLVTGFPPGQVHGTLHPSGAAAVVAANADLASAYAETAQRPSNYALAADLLGLVLHPGVHTNVGAVANTGTVTLDGDGHSDSVFVFQIGGALAMAAGSKVILTNGTQAKNVFWQVNGAGAVGADATFVGTLMTSAAIGVGANTLFNGRALAMTGAVTTNSNQFYANAPIVTIDGGAAVTVADDTPTISGTTTVDVPATVTVTVGTHVLSAAVQVDGTWSVTAAIMPNGVYTAQATVADGAANAGSASQSLTIDTVLPVVVVTGGAARLTNDATPTMDGTSDVTPGTIVTITVAGQTLMAVVQSAGTWNITPTPLSDGTYTVAVALVDEAGNPGVASQMLTVDTLAPVVAITGGANALTNNPTPTISGTSNEPGAAVSVSVSGLVTASTVDGGGGWSVTASALGDGGHPVAVSITDAAGNIGSSIQSLTIDTVAPDMSIDGGAAVATTDTTPTITGSTSAVAGSIVTVTVAGQTRTTLVQANGSWNVSPNALSIGVEQIVASVSDPAGNVGTATQELTVSDTAPPTPTTTTTAAPPATTTTTAPLVPTPPTNPTAPSLHSGSAVVAVGPKRVFDTRAGQSPNALRTVTKARVGGATELEVQFTDLAGFLPATGVLGVSLNVTETNAEASGFITVYPCGLREAVSSVNFAAAQTVANAVIAPVSSTGSVCFYSSTPTDIVVDINGWFPAGQAFAPVGPKRLLDTRSGEDGQTLRTVTKAPLPAGGTIEVPVTDLAGLVPAVGVDSVSLNVTVTNPRAAGFITVYACGTRELVSSVNYAAGQTVANAVTAPVSTRGTVCFYSLESADLVVDINGWFKGSAGFTGVSPKRVLDTRPGSSPDALRVVAKSKIGGDNILEVAVTDLPGVVPASGVAAVSLNLTATNPDGDGFISVYPCGAREEVSSLNYAAGQTIANAVTAPVSTRGTVCFFSLAPTDVIVDINGWFATEGPS